MTMTVMLQLTPEMEARLQEGLSQRDIDMVRQVLHDAVEPTVESLFIGRQTRLTVEEFDKLLDEMADIAAEGLPPDWPGLSDYALTREGIYEDHP